MVVLNRFDRFHLAMDVIERVPGLELEAAHLKQHFRDKLIEHRAYVGEHSEDTPEIPELAWVAGGRSRRLIAAMTHSTARMLRRDRRRRRAAE